MDVQSQYFCSKSCAVQSSTVHGCKRPAPIRAAALDSFPASISVTIAASFAAFQAFQGQRGGTARQLVSQPALTSRARKHGKLLSSGLTAFGNLSSTVPVGADALQGFPIGNIATLLTGLGLLLYLVKLVMTRCSVSRRYLQR